MMETLVRHENLLNLRKHGTGEALSLPQEYDLGIKKVLS